MRQGEPGRRRAEAGFALIVALLALVLLTVLGLTLSVTTSTELRIASNYRWSQQAYYNAEGGLELGKRFLRQIDWSEILPSARTGYSPNATPVQPTAQLARKGQGGESSRNFEGYECDTTDNVGYGVVLDHSSLSYPYQNVTNFLGEQLNGSFTLWVRRQRVVSPVSGATTIYDDSDDNAMILTAEGTAPFQGSTSATSFAIVSRAVRYLEIELERIDESDCENRTGQAGSGPSGAGFDQCDPLAGTLTLQGGSGSVVTGTNQASVK